MSASTASEPLHAIDVDLVCEQATMAKFKPYVADGWREFLSVGGGLAGAGGYSLPGIPYPPEGSADDRGGDRKALARGYLDRLGIVRAVLDAGVSGSLSGIANEVMGAELARASNDWLLDEWVDADSRFGAGIVVSPRDAGLAADEIRRLGSDPRVAQIVFSYPPCLLGDRSLTPIFQAAEEHDLPVVLRAGGAFAGRNSGVSAVGYPTSRFEYEVDVAAIAPPHLLSAICEGVFERFPRLRLVMSGFGIAWLPALLWRADAEFRSGRLKPPKGLQRLPSEVVCDHVRFTTDGLELPSDPEQLATLASFVRGEELLVFATGELPMDDRVPGPIDALPGEWRDRIMGDNARALYRSSAVVS